MRKATQDRIKERSEIRTLFLSIIRHPYVNGDVKKASKITIDEFIRLHPKYKNFRKRLADHIAEYHEPWFILDDKAFISEYKRLKPKGMKIKYHIRPRGATNRYNEIKTRKKNELESTSNDCLDGIFDDFKIIDTNDSAVASDGIHPLETAESSCFENGSFADDNENDNENENDLRFFF